MSTDSRSYYVPRQTARCEWPTKSGRPCRVEVRPGGRCSAHTAAADADAAAQRERRESIDAYVATTVIVGGARRECLLCECGVMMVAGIDHACRTDARQERGLPMA